MGFISVPKGGCIVSIEDGTFKGQYELVFYKEKSDIGQRDKSISRIEFQSFTDLKNFFYLNTSLVRRLAKVEKQMLEKHTGV